MGLDINAIKFLLDARASGVSFERTLTIGRQGLFVEPEALVELLTSRVRLASAADVRRMVEADEGFCESFLRGLGAKSTDSMDLSSYQAATILHDLNNPVPDSLKARFSVVIDSGSLEHVFSFPQAIKNCMEMVAVGGHFLCITIANNFMGHGFYQFSPELFYRVLSPANGFAVERMLIYEEYWPEIKFYSVADPELVRQRVTLANGRPTLLLIRARKVDSAPILALTPQQSDYVAHWQNYGPGERKAAHSAPVSNTQRRVLPLDTVARVIKSYVPASIKRRCRGWQRGSDPFKNSPFYKLVDL